LGRLEQSARLKTAGQLVASGFAMKQYMVVSEMWVH